MRRALYVVADVLAVVAVAGCGAAATRADTRAAPISAPVGRSDAAYVAKARADSARRPYTKADIDFVSGMISHHAQAIVIAGWAPSHGARPSIRVLCERIINAQKDEITLMQTWLADRQLPVPEARATGMRMVMDGVEHDMLMPGMLSEAQMRQLDGARGSGFDRLLLNLMIQHHQGAVTMVNTLFSSAGAGQDQTVFKLASDVNVDQSTEIARMEKMLVALTP